MHYMLTKEKRRKNLLMRVVAVLCIIVIVAVALSIYYSFQKSSIDQGALSVKEAVLDSAIQCAAIEGSYPSEISYLENNYGLSVNHDDYIVVYVCFASNTVPSVSVVPR